MKTKITAVILKDGKILSVRKRDSDIWILPGGGLEDGETNEEALKREIKEELDAGSRNYKFFDKLITDAIFEPGNIIMYVYFADLEGEPRPASEIEEIRWLESKEFPKLKVGSALSDIIMPRLVEERLMR